VVAGDGNGAQAVDDRWTQYLVPRVNFSLDYRGESVFAIEVEVIFVTI
jgi:hypothetical protein